MLIAPSILNADNLNLQSELTTAIKAGVSRFHIDIMDGHFVPNLSFGPQLVSDFKEKFPQINAEIHLMSDQPQTLVPAFVQAKADLVELHYEAMSEEELDHWLNYLLDHGVKTGIVLSPDTPVEVLTKFVDKIDQVLVMTVYPGFGGQKFLPKSSDRIQAVRQIVPDKVSIEVDGGINAQTAQIAKQAGADIFVAGSYIFQTGTITDQIAKLTEILQ
ncbi:ribulose-phosphate 3-epimerase [Lactobacillus sp. ESL0681]|uniref:ribulose-phosphate 3-epimerase n=1 Tax=Lactobacillus sp. ESL0681 TaxID=2983211 RepID=UPI0023FA1529|nr:ribulose-phosphate 3-epimerase [Lactobacillus sp. ESL0681]WEV40847.1 ribulose-phosphate 3-epimerase [Lactobacillus sp. ESL0681]